MKIKQIVKDAPKMLAEFYGITVKEAKENIKIGPQLVKDEWDACDVSFLEFYSLVENYPFDLAKFNTEYRLGYLRDITKYATADGIPHIENSFDKDRKLTLLDVGGGGGEYALLMSDIFDVTHVDVPGVTFNYAKFRAEKYGLDIKFCNEIPDEKFDVVVAMDVMEHVEDLDGLLASISGAMREGGLLLSSALWYNTNHFLHINEYAAYRNSFVVDFGNLFNLWLIMVIDIEGIKGKEAKGAIGIFRHRTDITNSLDIDNFYVAKQTGIVLIEDMNMDCIKSVTKTQFIFTVT